MTAPASSPLPLGHRHPRKPLGPLAGPSRSGTPAGPIQREVRLLGATTRGDQILDRSLSKVGGKGLFVKELEVALEERRADLAVHS